MNYSEHTIRLGQTNLVALTAEKGYIMCALLNLETAEKLGHAACTVTGVKTGKDILKAKITGCTTHARKHGIKNSMTGREALKLLQ
jgi:uncharacterized protein YunC (DUF1805 family)